LKVSSAQEPQSPDGESLESHAARISQLFRDHNRSLIGFLFAFLKDDQAAKEVAQEAYVKLLQLEQPSAIGFLNSYLFRVAKNLAIDRMRQEKNRARLQGEAYFDDFLEDSLGERALLARDELLRRGRIIEELPSKYRTAFRLHRLEEMPFDRIAQKMGIKERMARYYLTNTLVYLRLRLEGVEADAAWRHIQA